MFQLSTPGMNGPPGSLASGFRNPKQTVQQKNSNFEKRAKRQKLLKMDSTLNFGELDISTASEPFISDMPTPPRKVPRLASWLVADPRKKELTYKASITIKSEEILIEFDGFRITVTMHWR